MTKYTTHLSYHFQHRHTHTHIHTLTYSLTHSLTYTTMHTGMNQMVVGLDCLLPSAKWTKCISAALNVTETELEFLRYEAIVCNVR